MLVAMASTETALNTIFLNIDVSPVGSGPAPAAFLILTDALDAG
jgi:hypothetical protein